MRRKSAGKKIMAVLIAASLMLTPAELTVAAEMETEGAEAAFLAEESGDIASSDPEDTAETETEITDGSAVIEEQETTDTDKPDTGNNVQENAETGVMESGEEAPEGAAEEENPEATEAAMDEAEALEECEQAEENTAFDDGTKDAVQASAEYSDGKITWTLDADGTLTIDGNNVQLTEQDEDSTKLEEAGITQGKVKKIVIGNGITALREGCLRTFKSWISELVIMRASIEDSSYSNTSVFTNCEKLEKVTLAEGVEEIPDSAFSMCENLSQVQIGGSVKRIGKYAFHDCKSLKEITLPESVQSIDEWAFHSSGLEKINIKGMAEIGWAAFTNCASLKSFPFDHVNKIGESAFSDSGIAGSITLPDNVESLGENAFDHCKNLEEVIIQNCVVNGNSFNDCTNLKCLTMNGGEISGTIYAEKLILNSNVKKVGIFSGSDMKELEINGPSDMEFHKDFAHSVSGLEKVVISGQLNLPEYAFSGSKKLKQVVLKNGVSALENEMFDNCENLESVSFENVSLKTISTGTFANCGNLKTITLPETVTKIDTYAFENCKKLEQIQIPSKTETIGRAAFLECSALQKISIPSSVKTIEAWAFANTGIKEVALQDGLKTIESSAFSSCLNMKKIRIPKTVTKMENHAVGTMDVGNEIQVIPGGFTVEGYTNSAAEKYVERMTKGSKFKGLKFVSIGKLPATVTNISKTKISALKTRAFTGKPLTQALTITYGGKKLVNGRDYTLTWKNNTNIGTASVTIKGKGKYNGSVTKKFRITVQKNAVYTVSRLKYKISNADTSGKGTVVFTGTTDKAARKSLTIPTTVKIGGKNFRVTAIGGSAMSGAKKLTTLKVGGNVTTIGAKAFYGCSKLSNVTIAGTKLTTAKTGANAFKGIRSNCRFKVPASRVSAYKKLLRAKGAGPKIIVTK